MICLLLTLKLIYRDKKYLSNMKYESIDKIIKKYQKRKDKQINLNNKKDYITLWTDIK